MGLPRGADRPLLLGGWLGAMALALVWVGHLVPGLGALPEVLVPFPLALAVVRLGPRGAGLMGGVVAGAVAALFGGTGAAVFALEHLLPGIILGLALAWGLPLSILLLLVTASTLLGVAVLFAAFLPVTSGSPLAVLSAGIERGVSELPLLTARLGLGEEQSAFLRESVESVVAALREVLPAVFVLGILFGAFLNYLLARALLRRSGARPFALEVFPDHLVWAVIGAGLLLAIRVPPWDAIGLNVLLVTGACYLIQGLAVLRHLFQKGRIPRPVQGLGFALLFLQPLFLILVAGLGLSDLWMDFRKIRRIPTPA